MGGDVAVEGHACGDVAARTGADVHTGRGRCGEPQKGRLSRVGARHPSLVTGGGKGRGRLRRDAPEDTTRRRLGGKDERGRVALVRRRHACF